MRFLVLAPSTAAAAAAPPQALLLTVVTNLTAVVTTPFWLSAIFATANSSTDGAEIDAVSLLLKLLVTVLTPLVFGKLVRELVPGSKPFIAKHKTKLGVCNNLSLTLIVWMTISDAAEDLLAVPFVDVFVVILCGIAIHVVYLSLNWPMGKYALKLELPEFKAVTIMASQKTLPLSVTIISYLGALGTTGLMTLPCIVGHMSQLFIDAGLQSMWLAQAAKQQKAAQAAAKAAGAAAAAEALERGDGNGDGDGGKRRRQEGGGGAVVAVGEGAGGDGDGDGDEAAGTNSSHSSSPSGSGGVVTPVVAV
jgi:solute carrier family 10 (sodium/bile acid cotransporter), member 7